MYRYLDLMSKVLEEGTAHENRTGIRTRRISGAHLQFDLRDGFPAVTTKQLAFDSVKAELIGFIRGVDNAGAFRDLGTKIWDTNANVTPSWVTSVHRKGRDDLGRIYGVQWRRWETYERGYIDQFLRTITSIRNDPDSRRIIVSAWNVADLDRMALPPCHVLYQAMPDAKSGKLDLCVYIRSWDLFLGAPFNIASYALLTELISRACGYEARVLNIFAADVHIYENHIKQVEEQLNREPYPLPILKVDMAQLMEPGVWLTQVLQPGHIRLENYVSHPAIAAPMAA